MISNDPVKDKDDVAALAKQRAHAMKLATIELTRDGTAINDIPAKALLVVNSHLHKLHKAPYVCDGTQIDTVVAKLNEMNTAQTEAHLTVLANEYLVTLPAEPYEAIYIARQAIDLMNKTHSYLY